MRLCGVVHCVQLVWRFNTLHSTGSLRNEPRGLVTCVRDMWFSKLHDEEPEGATEFLWFSKPNVCRRACQLVTVCLKTWGTKEKLCGLVSRVPKTREAQKHNYVV